MNFTALGLKWKVRLLFHSENYSFNWTKYLTSILLGFYILVYKMYLCSNNICCLISFSKYSKTYFRKAGKKKKKNRIVSNGIDLCLIINSTSKKLMLLYPNRVHVSTAILKYFFRLFQKLLVEIRKVICFFIIENIHIYVEIMFVIHKGEAILCLVSRAQGHCLLCQLVL